VARSKQNAPLGQSAAWGILFVFVIDLDWGSCGDGFPDVVHVGVWERDTAVDPIDPMLCRPDPSQTVLQAVNLYVAAG
jgi:hypothetical protein